MRRLTIILAFYLVGLCLVPCNDAYDDYFIELAAHSNGHDHDHGSESDCIDFCSPFCTCTCCHIVAEAQFEFVALKAQKPTYIDAIKYPRHPKKLQSRDKSSVWQPPRTLA